MAGQNELLLVKDEVIEYMEKSVLGAWLPDKVLDVIDYQGVDTLVEVDEVVDFTAMDRLSYIDIRKDVP